MLKYRGPKTLCDIFLDFITTDLIRAICVNSKDLHGWQFKPGKRLCGGSFEKKLCCSVFIATSIFREMKGMQMSNLLTAFLSLTLTPIENIESLGQLSLSS